MKELHTKMPLSVFGDGNHIMGIPLDQADALGLPHIQWTHNAPDDIARRLVACWNHCAGLDTEGMEIGNDLDRTARVYLDELVGQCAEAEHQRNELQRELFGARESIQRANERWYSAARDVAIAQGECDALKAQRNQLLAALLQVKEFLAQQKTNCRTGGDGSAVLADDLGSALRIWGIVDSAIAAASSKAASVPVDESTLLPVLRALVELFSPVATDSTQKVWIDKANNILRLAGDGQVDNASAWEACHGYMLKKVRPTADGSQREEEGGAA